MPVAEVVPLAGVLLNPDGVLRDYTRPEGHRQESYLAEYDRRTLVYDTVWRADLGRYIATAPPFLNLWEPYRQSLSKDGQRVGNLKRREWKRCEQIEFDGPEGSLSVSIGDHTYDVPTRPGTQEKFRGLNCLLALNKNNRLEWITDWLSFHVRKHGAQGVVIVDNGSTDYPLPDLADALASVEGVEAAVVYDAPYPYGPLGGRASKKERQAKFFQSAMLNLGRADALAHARAVLSVDIDEIVDGPEGRSVFDAAVKNPFGMTTIKGYWANPESADVMPCRHREHRWRGAVNKQCNRKWCMVPSGLIGRNFPWDPHQIGGILQNAFTEQRAFTHNHCRGVSTGWKQSRFKYTEDLVRDPALDTLMERYFPSE